MSQLKFMAAIGGATLMIAGVMATPSAAQRGDRSYDRGDRSYERGDYGRPDDEDRDVRRGGYGGNLTSSYVDSLEWRINNAANEGRLGRGQARQLLSEFRQVQQSAHRVETGQASRWERERLASVVRRIEAATSERAGYQGRNRRYGYN